MMTWHPPVCGSRVRQVVEHLDVEQLRSQAGGRSARETPA